MSLANVNFKPLIRISDISWLELRLYIHTYPNHPLEGFVRILELKDIPPCFVKNGVLQDAAIDFAELPEDLQERVFVYSTEGGGNSTHANYLVEEAFEKHCGNWETPAEFAKDYVRDSFDLDKMPKMLLKCLDYDKVAQHLTDDFIFTSGGMVFRK